jgi:1,4-alpha-glucan branching enzyme
MPGDEWQKFANLRLMFTYMFTHPGSKLLFMGGEIAQSAEWNHDKGLDWHLLQYDFHAGVQKIIRDLNELYKTEKALYKYAFEPRGFKWVDYGDRENSVIVYQRDADEKEETMIVVCNFTPAVRYLYRIGVPYRGKWKETFNSDDTRYGGSGLVNTESLNTSPVKFHGRDYSVSVNLPPLGITILKLEKEVNEFQLNETST